MRPKNEIGLRIGYWIRIPSGCACNVLLSVTVICLLLIKAVSVVVARGPLKLRVGRSPTRCGFFSAVGRSVGPRRSGGDLRYVSSEHVAAALWPLSHRSSRVARRAGGFRRAGGRGTRNEGAGEFSDNERTSLRMSDRCTAYSRPWCGDRAGLDISAAVCRRLSASFLGVHAYIAALRSDYCAVCYIGIPRRRFPSEGGTVCRHTSELLQQWA